MLTPRRYSTYAHRRNPCVPMPPPSGRPHHVPSEDQIIDVLRPVEDPELHRSIVDLGMIRFIRIDGASVHVEVALTVAGCPLKNEIERRVGEAVHALDDVDSVRVAYDVMTDEERAKVRELMVGDPASTAGSQASHGHAEGRAIPFADPSSK